MVEAPYLLSFVGYVSRCAEANSLTIAIGSFLPVTFVYIFELLRQLCNGLGNIEAAFTCLISKQITPFTPGRAFEFASLVG